MYKNNNSAIMRYNEINLNKNALIGGIKMFENIVGKLKNKVITDEIIQNTINHIFINNKSVLYNFDNEIFIEINRECIIYYVIASDLLDYDKCYGVMLNFCEFIKYEKGITKNELNRYRKTIEKQYELNIRHFNNHMRVS